MNAGCKSLELLVQHQQDYYFDMHALSSALIRKALLRMSHEGGDKPGKESGRRVMSLNGMPLSVTRAARRFACNVNQQGVGAEIPAATSLCNTLNTKRHQGSSGTAKPPGREQTIADRLILMGDWCDSFAANI